MFTLAGHSTLEIVKVHSLHCVGGGLCMCKGESEATATTPPPPPPPTSSWDSWETDIRLGDGCNSPWLERRLRGNKQDYLSQQMKKWLLLFDLDPKRNNIFTTNETVNCYLCLSCTEIVKSMEKLGRQADKKGVLSFGRLLARFLYIISSHLHKISRIITTGSALLFDELHFL